MSTMTLIPRFCAAMKEIVSKVEKNENHIWHGYLAELTSHAFQPYLLKGRRDRRRLFFLMST